MTPPDVVPSAPEPTKAASGTRYILAFWTIFVVAVAGIVTLSTRLGDANQRVDQLHEARTNDQAEIKKLHDETMELMLEVREVRMLYEEARHAGSHMVSDDGRLEMYTYREEGDGGHRLCAHWCTHNMPHLLDEPCMQSGPDRCLPDD